MKLNAKQQRHKEALEWLLSNVENRQQGKTFLMEFIFAERAIRLLKIPVYFYDHSRFIIKQNVKHFGEQIVKIGNEILKKDMNCIGTWEIDEKNQTITLECFKKLT